MLQSWPPVKYTLVDNNYTLFRHVVQHCLVVPGNRVLLIGETDHDASDFVDAIDRVQYEGNGKTYHFKNGSIIYQRKNNAGLKALASSMELGGYYVEGNTPLDPDLENFLYSRLRLQAARNDRRVVTALPIARVPTAADYGYRSAIVTAMGTPRKPDDALSLDRNVRLRLHDLQIEGETGSTLERIRLNIDELRKWLDFYQRESEEFVKTGSRVDGHAKKIKDAILHRAAWVDKDSEGNWKRHSSEETLERAIKDAHDEIGELAQHAVIKAKKDASDQLHRVIISTNTFPTNKEDEDDE